MQSAVVGTPDDLVEFIRKMYEITGGFGTAIGFVHDWANPRDTVNSWDLVARYVIPEINGYTKKLRESQEFVSTKREAFNRAGEAILDKIMGNEKAAEALQVTAARNKNKGNKN